MHKPVLLKEVVNFIEPQIRRNILDATVSGGGHSLEILDKNPEARILGIEWDKEIAKELESKLEDAGLNEKLKVVNNSYVNIRKIAEENNFEPEAILFDLGLSSWHYEQSGRGFSFQKDELLDMRFNPESGAPTAAEIVNTSDPREIERILREYGEEELAPQITRAIIERRQESVIVKSGDLAEIILNAVPEWYKHKKIHPATKTFQALRIAVNEELENVKIGISDAIDILKPGGRIAVIAFHGLEDKIVKDFFKAKAGAGAINLITKKPVQASWEERKSNPRSRSAKLRVAEKI